MGMCFFSICSPEERSLTCFRSVQLISFHLGLASNDNEREDI